MHLPKTGGTSLHDILASRIPPTKIHKERLNALKKYSVNTLEGFDLYSGHYDWSNVECVPGPKRIITMFREPTARILSLYYFWRSFTWETIEAANLGGPRVAKSVSLIEFLRHRGDGIPGNINNAMTRNLLGVVYCGPEDQYHYHPWRVQHIVKRRIKSLTAFGILESFDESAQKILKALNLPPTESVPHKKSFEGLIQSHQHEPIEREAVTPEIIKELKRLTNLDRPLYKWACKRFKRLKS